ncbi:hypothetical protein [Pseudonocardia sp.]|jgi:hypothetical protein|uniref:hypothetical protein n=1 Tax=Pseudonocardia sp. TaxID=60912 RepID=UPI003D0D1627
MTISVLAWVLVGVAGWLVAAVVVALLVGRLFHLREEAIGRDRPPMPVRRARPVGPPVADRTPPPADGSAQAEPGRDLPGRQVPRIPQQRRPVPRARRPRIGPATRRG